MFAEPTAYWVGMRTPGASEADEADFAAFYAHHAEEVLAANPGFARCHRYRLLVPDPRGDLGPTWLAVYELTEEGAAAYERREDAGDRPAYSSGPPVWERREVLWRMIWRRRHVVGSTVPGAVLYVVGMHPGPVGPGGLGEFEDFYSAVHLPEVVAAGGYGAGTRLSLARAFAFPGGCPPFCAVYEAGGEQAAAIRRGEVVPTAPDPGRRLSAGPTSWEERDVVFRLVYEPVAPPVEAATLS